MSKGLVFGQERTRKEIRVYNWKRQTVKDTRTGLVLPLREVLEGDLEPFIRALRSTVTTA